MIIFLSILLCASSSLADFTTTSTTTVTTTLTATWTGVAGVILRDSDTTLVFDAVFTKPNLKHWVLNSTFTSNSELVSQNLKQLGIKKADAVFASHTHFDHAIDICEISKQTGAIMYGGESLKTLVKKQEPISQYKDLKFKDLQNKKPLQVGQFKLTFFQRTHAPIIRSINLEFLPDSVSERFESKFYDYHAGETWATLIEHPEGVIIFDQSAVLHDELYQAIPKGKKVIAHFVGTSNKISFDDLVKNNIEKVAAKNVIPIHFDFFFLQNNWLETLVLPATQIYDIQKKLSQNHQVNFLIPVKNQMIKL